MKIVKKESDAEATETTINSITIDRDFPTIGYAKAGASGFVWAKTT